MMQPWWRSLIPGRTREDVIRGFRWIIHQLNLLQLMRGTWIFKRTMEKHTPLKLTSTCLHTPSTVLIANGRISAIPALFTRILFPSSTLLSPLLLRKGTHSTTPKSLSTSPNTFLAFSKSATLQPYVLTLTPSLSHAVRVASCFETLRSRSARLAPDLASAREIAAPIPELNILTLVIYYLRVEEWDVPPAAPVTTATFPWLDFAKVSGEMAG